MTNYEHCASQLDILGCIRDISISYRSNTVNNTAQIQLTNTTPDVQNRVVVIFVMDEQSFING